MIPYKWGHGQLFAYSALDGDSHFGDDFAGILSGDKIGISFFSKIVRSLYFTNITAADTPEFRAVTGDIILLETREGTASIIFARKHLIIGETAGEIYVCTDVQGKADIYSDNGIEIHDTNDGEFTAIYRKGRKFAFSYGKTNEEVLDLCKKGIELDTETEKNKKLEVYKKYSLPENNKFASLYTKCLSVMKTQLYSPEGNIKRIWSTPDRLPHRNMWLWDSVFHAAGHRNIDVAIAQNLILALFDVQREDGFIPHMARPDYASDITQPCIIGWGAYLVYQKSRDKEFLETVLRNNKKFLLWCRNNRRKSEKELYLWHTNAQKNNRCDESGMDNSPRFDTPNPLYAVDFSCYIANDVRYMKKIAEEIGDSENAIFFDGWYKKIKEDINDMLWCREDGFYYDFDITENRFNKVQSVASFLPLFAGVCDSEQAKALVEHLESPEEFGTQFPLPSISKKDKNFGTDMWRGPVWINYNYMISHGLSDYGYNGLSREIINKTLETINEWYQRTGTIYEFYDSENQIPPACFNRKGSVFEPYDFMIKYQSIRDYGWSSTLVFDLLCNNGI